MLASSKPIEPISVRRASIVDSDKVRYRVYSTPSEFIAVIAENALLAVKVSGVKNPHKIVRDLPTDGIAVEAQKMAAISDADTRVAFPLTPPPEDISKKLAEMLPPPEALEAKFEAMGVAELQRKGQPRARIMPPDMLYQIIEEHVRSHTPVASALEPTAPAPQPTHVAPEPEPEAPSPAPMAAAIEPNTEIQDSQARDAILNAKPHPPTAESIAAMADALLPPVTPQSEVAQANAENAELSPEEVAKLLGE